MRKLTWMLQLAVSSGIVLAGCKSNPYPQESTIVTIKPEEPRRVEAPYGFTVPEILEFTEGQESKHQIEAWVPEPDEPLISVAGLPTDAKFDSKTKTITWTPSYTAGNPEDKPEILQRTYPVTLKLTAASTPYAVLERKVVFLVKDTPRPIVVKLDNANPTLTENMAFEQRIDVESDDFPKGPFEVITDLGLSTTIRRVANQPRVYLQYMPTYGDSTFWTSRDATITVVAPNGVRQAVKTSWKLKDVPQVPMISGATRVKQGPTVSFQLYAEDVNRLGPPTAAIITGPKVGKVKLETEKKNGSADKLPSTLAIVNWTDIPESMYGKTQRFDLEFCSKSACKQAAVDVEVAGWNHTAPLVDRGKWPLGTIQYLRQGGTLKIAVPVKDTEVSTNPVDVTLEPKGVKGVKWAGGFLEVSPEKVGTLQFNVVATSMYGVRTVESFIVEALSGRWASELILAESTATTEINSIIRLFKKAQVFSPESLTDLDSRTLALRDTLVVTSSIVSTGILADKAFADVLSKVKNVVVLSPAVGGITGLATELKNNYVTVKRLSDFGQALSTFNITTGRDWTTPDKPIALKGTFSGYSAEPAYFQVKSYSACDVELIYENKVTGELSAGVICPRSTGGKLLISGFEWGDMDLSKDDEDLPMTWIKEWMR